MRPHIFNDFDAQFYLDVYADVAAAAVKQGGDPFEFARQHFLNYGLNEGRKADAFFDPQYYLSHNADVAAYAQSHGLNANAFALAHFEANGWKEGRDPSATFDISDYLDFNKDVAAAGVNPLIHYLTYGFDEGRDAFPVDKPPPQTITVTQVVTQQVISPVPVDVPVPTPVNVHTESFGTLSSDMTNSNGNSFFGDGTTRANGNVIAEDPDSGSVMALAVAPRQAAGDGAGKFLASNVVSDGAMVEATTFVPSGSQSLQTGSFQDNANRGAFNVIINAGNHNGLHDALADGHSIQLGIDTDPSAAVSYLYFDLFEASDGTFQFRTQNAAIHGDIDDNKGNAFVTSNSEQLNFFLPGATDADKVALLSQGAQFDITLTDHAADGHLVAGVTQHLILGPHSVDPHNPNADGALLIV